jgi:hypothetical protein
MNAYMKMQKWLTLAAGLLMTAVSYAQENNAWVVPKLPPPQGQLPRLAQPLALDGELKEWAGAASLPVLYRSDFIVPPQDPGRWQGAADAGMEVFQAWNEEGLCLAVRVVDDDVFNDSADPDSWMQDCFEMYLDGRRQDLLMSVPFSKGAYKAQFRPPLNGKHNFSRLGGKNQGRKTPFFSFLGR